MAPRCRISSSSPTPANVSKKHLVITLKSSLLGASPAALWRSPSPCRLNAALARASSMAGEGRVSRALRMNAAVVHHGNTWGNSTSSPWTTVALLAPPSCSNTIR